MTKPQNWKCSHLRANYGSVHSVLTEEFDFLFRDALWSLWSKQIVHIININVQIKDKLQFLHTSMLIIWIPCQLIVEVFQHVWTQLLCPSWLCLCSWNWKSQTNAILPKTQSVGDFIWSQEIMSHHFPLIYQSSDQYQLFVNLQYQANFTNTSLLIKFPDSLWFESWIPTRFVTWWICLNQRSCLGWFLAQGGSRSPRSEQSPALHVPSPRRMRSIIRQIKVAGDA